MLNRPVEQLPLGNQFNGAGIYAIYYVGNFAPYRIIAEQNRDPVKSFSRPIYIGKAVPEGARKGGYGLNDNPGAVLFSRLSEHAASIRQAQNLDIEDFHCRYLVVDDIWIPLAESLLIREFAPAWNKVLDGFGNHAPGSGRSGQRRSSWDTIHPGRSWATRLRDNSLRTMPFSNA